MEQYPIQEQDLIYALDIGTRSVIGILGRREQDRIHVLEIEKQPHIRRTMLDGQIEDIHQVAKVVISVTKQLEQRVGRKLVRACVAAAGRALRTETGTGVIELPAPERILEDRIGQLELEAVADAERILQEGDTHEQRLFLVGYTVKQFQLDHYPMANLHGHTGNILEACVVATFLPSEVVDSLYAVMAEAGLEVASLTLEPIAALNAAIPSDIRLLNLALVDIGAGTSDIALCRDGSVTGYTMATTAGDEITEALMRTCLVDYPTAERIKMELGKGEPIVFCDIVGMEQTYTPEEIFQFLDKEVQALATEIAQRIQELNGGAPSALFLAGGGSKLATLCQQVAQALGMDERRVAVAGRYFQNSVYSDTISLEDPEYTTPLGILVSAGLELIRDSYRIQLNGKPAKLFRSGHLSVLEVLMMNGYKRTDLIGRSGKTLMVQIDGRRAVFYGEPATPAILKVNDESVQPSASVHAGDRIQFQPATSGSDRYLTAGELMEQLGVTQLWADGVSLTPDTQLTTGMQIETEPHTSSKQPSQPILFSYEDRIPEVQIPEAPSSTVQNSQEYTQPDSSILEPEVSTPSVVPVSVPRKPSIGVTLNGEGLQLIEKEDHSPYYLMDLLERSGIDFKNLKREVVLTINGEDCTFQQPLKDGDQVEIKYADEQ